MIDISLYKDGDAYLIETIPGIFEPAGYLKASTDMLCKSPNVIAHTVRKDNIVIAIFGFTIIWPGVVEVWSLLSEEIKKVPLTIVKTVLTGMSFYQRHLHVRRFQMTVKNDYDLGHRWASFLGFSLEGIMHKWGPDGSDFAIYGRTY